MGNEGRTHCTFCTVIPDTENRITGNGEKWLQPLNLAGVVAIFFLRLGAGADGDRDVDSGGDEFFASYLAVKWIGKRFMERKLYILVICCSFERKIKRCCQMVNKYNLMR